MCCQRDTQTQRSAERPPRGKVRTESTRKVKKNDGASPGASLESLLKWSSMESVKVTVEGGGLDQCGEGVEVDELVLLLLVQLHDALFLPTQPDAHCSERLLGAVDAFCLSRLVGLLEFVVWVWVWVLLSPTQRGEVEERENPRA
eukprot:144364-Rhodomonas_salina.1